MFQKDCNNRIKPFAEIFDLPPQSKQHMKKIYLATGALLALALGQEEATAQTSTFSYTGAAQTYTVPPCVTSIQIEAWGAQGGIGSNGGPASGNGGYTRGTITVTAGQVFNIYVGGQGAQPGGGFNGGGTGGSTSTIGGGGGGATDIRTPGNTLADRIMVAAGGGGSGGASTYGPTGGAGGSGTACASPNGFGGAGAGGCAVGGSGGCAGGTAPNYGTGGAGAGLNAGGGTSGSGTGVYGTAGSLGVGGNGGNYVNRNGGGGGGGGYYGGAGGMSGSGGCNGGGGGGSSYVDNILFTSITFTGGTRTGNGQVTITVVSTTTPPSSPVSITGSTTFCEGTSSTFSTGTVAGATSYTWSVPAGSVINSGQGTTSISVTFGPSSGNVSVTADNSCGSSAPTNLALTINAAPPVVANSTASALCTGGSVTLTGSGATSYSWSGGVTDGIAFVPTITDTYTVTGTDGNGCTNTAITTVTVNSLPTVTANTSANTVCEGTNVTLTGGGASTYSWTGGVTDGVPFAATVTDTYTVTGTDGNGCTNTAMVSVTVNPLPAVAANSTANAICIGDSVVLTGSGAISYTWTGGANDGVAFAPTATDTYTVTGTDANGCTNVASSTVTVNALPVVSLGPDSTQCGGSITLDAMNTGATYMWNDSTTAQTNNVTSSGIYAVVVTDTNGCVSTDSVNVTINAVPVINFGADTSLCGGTLTLDAQNAGSTYMWNDSTTAQTMVVSSNGTYYVDVTSADGCAGTDTIMVTINTPPTVNGTASSGSVCADDANVTLTGTPSGGAWSGPGVTGNAFDPSVGAGSYQPTYTYTDTNGCSGTAQVSIAVSACVGIQEQAATGGFFVYPNPNTGTFSLAIANDAESMQIEITDAEGRVVYAANENAVSAGSVYQVSMENLSNGIYFMRVTTPDNMQMIRVAVQQ